jgi:protein SCO1/2
MKATAALLALHLVLSASAPSLPVGDRARETSPVPEASLEDLAGHVPVLLVLAYYRCPMLCGLVLRGLVTSLQHLDFHLGNAYRALTVSVDPRDTPESARAKQQATLQGLSGATSKAAAWPFVVGDETESRRLAAEVGFGFAYDSRTDQYAHPAVVVVLTADGRISRYLYGIEYSPRDLRLALVEAGEGKIGSIVDRVLLTCYHYDPARRAYAPFVVGFLRIGAALTLVVVLTIILLSAAAARRARRPSQCGSGSPS